MQSSTSSRIELHDFPSNSRSDRQSPPRRSKSKSQPPKYRPQKDEDSHLESQVKSQSLTTWSKVCRNKTINLPILLILCIAIVDIPILGAGTSYFMKQDSLKVTMQESMLKPLQFMSENLKADPIMDIQLRESGYPCPVGFQRIRLGIWPGGETGCLCDNGDLYRDSCGKVNSLQCNTELLSSFKINLYEWGGVEWCAKKAVIGTDYLKQAVCPSNYKECYPGGCFMGDCPLTGIDRSPDGGLVLLKVQGEPPLINIQQTLGETPCDLQEAESYKTVANKEDECDKYGLNLETRTRLGSQIAYFAYLENYFPYSFMRLPQFVGDRTATSSVLSYVTRMRTAKFDYCQDIDEKAIDNVLQVIPDKIDLGCLVLVFLLQLKIFFDIICSITPNSQTKLFKNTSKLVRTSCILNIITFITVIIMLANFARVYQVFRTTKKYFEDYYSLGCFFEGQGWMVIQDYLEILKIASEGSWVYMALLVSKVLSGWLCFRLYVVKKRLSEGKKGQSFQIWNFSVKKFLDSFWY